MAQLMCFLQHVGRGFGPFWCGLMLDVEYKPLEDIKAKGNLLFAGSGGRFKNNKADYFWEWPGGEKLFLRAARNIDTAENFLGHGYAYIAFNELTKWQTSEVYDRLLATIRAAELRAMGIKPLVFSTTNPYGPGAIWAKDRFIGIIPYGWLHSEEVEVPLDLEGNVTTVQKTKVAIPGSFLENPHYTAEDRANLLEACQDRPELYKAWVEGSWDAPYMDGALGAVWRTNIHVVDNFKIPPNWRMNRAFDWGSRAPFSVGWFAESNGEEWTDEHGERRCYPRGTVVQFAEWYGSKSIGKNRGLKLSAREVAQGIRTREANFRATGMIHGDQKIYPGPADNQIAAVTGIGTATIKSEMAKYGATWLESQKGAGSRAIGLQAIISGLRNATLKEGPGLYFMRRCKAGIKILPSLQADGEDIAKDQEDHCYDMLRYRLVQKKRGATRNVTGGF